MKFLINENTVMPWCIPWGKSHILRSNIYIVIILYNTSNPFICTILIDLSESSKIALFKDFILEIIDFKVTDKSKKINFPLNNVILGDSNSTNCTNECIAIIHAII